MLTSFLVKLRVCEKITVGLVYRPPAQTPEVGKRFYDQIAEICNGLDCIIVDYNILVSKWGESPSSSSGHGFYLNLLASALIQLVKKCTHDKNILDLVLTTNEDLVNNVEVGEEFGTSDNHKLLLKVTFNTACSVGQYDSHEKVPSFK